MTEWKVLDCRMRSCQGGHGKWTPGRRRSVRGALEPCYNGLHICRDEQDLLARLGDVICPVAERSDEYVDADDKRVCRWVVIGEPNAYWDERTARHFACDCAEYVMPHAGEDQRGLLQAIVDVTRAYADWPEEWTAERDAAQCAADEQAVEEKKICGRWEPADAVKAAVNGDVRHAAQAAVGLLVFLAWAAVEDWRWLAPGEDEEIETAAQADLVAILKTYLDGTSEWVVKDD